METVSPAEVERRYANVREALVRDGLDAVIVSGSEYSGFEGAVRYLSGFLIVHRYAYVLLPVEGDPSIVFPVEARYVGEHGTTWIDEQVFVDAPGAWLRDRARDRGWKRVGVYGLDYVMTVRDYQALAGGELELVPYDVEFDLARAVKSDEELASVRDSVRINAEGFWIFLDAFAVGRSEAELLGPCEDYFVDEGCGRQTMDMVLVGENGEAEPEFRIASRDRRIREGDLVLPSLEIAGPGGHWVEVSRAIAAGGAAPGPEARRMLEAYEDEVLADEDVVRPADLDQVDGVRAVAQQQHTVDCAGRILGDRDGLGLVCRRSGDDCSRPGMPARRDLTDGSLVRTTRLRLVQPTRLRHGRSVRCS